MGPENDGYRLVVRFEDKRLQEEFNRQAPQMEVDDELMRTVYSGLDHAERRERRERDFDGDRDFAPIWRGALFVRRGVRLSVCYQCHG